MRDYKNIKYQIDKPKELKVLSTQDVNRRIELVATICCNDNQKCAYIDCEQCSQKKAPPQNHDPGQQVKLKRGLHYEWNILIIKVLKTKLPQFW